MAAVWIALGVAALAAVWAVWTFNSLTRHRNFVREAWSGVDVQLRRRHDLIPNLVKIAEAYRLHERNLLEDLTAKRAESRDSERVADKAAAERGLGQALISLFAVAENYPDLKASDVYVRLQHDLVAIEDDLQMARRYYNGTVRNLNNKVQMFPQSLIARIFGFKAADFFEIEDALMRAAPDVEAIANG